MFGLLGSRIGVKQLAALCRRLSIALAAGLDLRRAIRREADDARGPVLRSHLVQISDGVAAGDTLSDALARTGGYFPPLVHEMVDLGESAGHLDGALRRLAEHYEMKVRLRRTFLQRIAWPMVQLVIAILVIAMYLLVISAIGSRGAQHAGEFGGFARQQSGFFSYLLTLAVLGGGAWLVYQAARRGMLSIEPVQKALMQVPVIGGPLRTISLAQMAWTMDITLGAGLEVTKAIDLSLRSTRNAHFTQHRDEVLAAIRAGDEIHAALAATGAFPPEFLAGVEVGEQGGRLPEAMSNLARIYQEEAEHALAMLTNIAGWLVWLAVGVTIVSMILRGAMQYVNMINQAVEGI